MKKIKNTNRNNVLNEGGIWFVSEPRFTPVFYPSNIAQIKMDR